MFNLQNHSQWLAATTTSNLTSVTLVNNRFSFYNILWCCTDTQSFKDRNFKPLHKIVKKNAETC